MSAPGLHSPNRRLGLVLILVGAVAFGARFAGAVPWPLFVLAPGLALLAAGLLAGRGAARLVVPGTIVTTVGLILLVQNATDTFESWSYAWGLVLASVGAGRALLGRSREDPALVREGARLLYLGLLLFAAFGAFFEFVVFADADAVGRYLLPLLLVAAGVFLLWRERRGAKPREER